MEEDRSEPGQVTSTHAEPGCSSGHRRIPFGGANPFILRDSEGSEQRLFRIDIEGLAGDLPDDSGEDLREAPVVVPRCAGLLAERTRQDEFYRVLHGRHL